MMTCLRALNSESRYGTTLLAENAADIVPVTNPFLKEMLQTFLTVGGRQGGIDYNALKKPLKKRL